MSDTASPTEKQASADIAAEAVCDVWLGSGRWRTETEARKDKWRGSVNAAIDVLADSGFVIVPREPTAEMIEAHIEECAGDAGEAGPDRIRSCWRAMVDASPWINHAAGR